MNTEARSEQALDVPTKEVTTGGSAPLDARGLLARLNETSPAFRDTKPLALRIDRAIAERFPDVDRRVIRAAMRMYTNSTRYLKALERGTHRYGLDGREDGELSEEHRAHAAQTLKERFAEVARKKREKDKEAEALRREAEAERRRADKLRQLVGKFSRG